MVGDLYRTVQPATQVVWAFVQWTIQGVDRGSGNVKRVLILSYCFPVAIESKEAIPGFAVFFISFFRAGVIGGRWAAFSLESVMFRRTGTCWTCQAANSFHRSPQCAVGKIASGCCIRGSRAMMRDRSRAGMGVNSECRIRCRAGNEIHFSGPTKRESGVAPDSATGTVTLPGKTGKQIDAGRVPGRSAGLRNPISFFQDPLPLHEHTPGRLWHPATGGNFGFQFFGVGPAGRCSLE